MVASFDSTLQASDWNRFRGPNGSGVSADGAVPPKAWSDTENLLWKAELPGPGSSCPIIIGDKVIVTCWTGYGTDRQNLGEMEQLKRNVICLNRADGTVLWNHEEAAVLPEDEYRGMFAEHGYSSHTPVSDGENVYVFFGKTGVLALSLADGKPLWKTPVGENLEQRGWGSASSPILVEDLVIVPAFVEGDSLVALKKSTGEVVWKQTAPGYDGNWSTPILVKVDETRTDIVIAVPGEIWGVNPENGKLRWFCVVPGSDSARASVIEHNGIIYAMSGRGGGCVAIKAGGKGDVSEKNVLWSNPSDNSGIGTPVLVNDRMYLFSGRTATVVDAKTGERIEQMRLRTTTTGAAPESGRSEQPAQSPQGGPGQQGGPGGGFGGGFGGGGRGGRGGGAGGQDYASPVVAGNLLFYPARNGDFFVFELGEKLTQVSTNNFGEDRSDFSASPAVADGQLFVRSAKAVYCIVQK
ncbi:MAG: PQQ-like beta-propeller repeat protein [Planctomyces sp.]|nr:PQQ-like beta-propeller repeat protein [Planctomyces sp.]